MTIAKMKNIVKKEAIGKSKTELLSYIGALFGEEAEINYEETAKGIPVVISVCIPKQTRGIWFYFDKTTRRVATIY